MNTFSQGTQLPAVPRSQIRGIVERDAISCLGLDAIISPRTDEADLEPQLPVDSPAGALTDANDPMEP